MSNPYGKLTLKEVEQALLKDPANKDLLEMLKYHKDFIKKLAGVFERDNQQYYRR